MGWDCPRCAAENPLSATRCLSCGYQYFPGYDSAASIPDRSRELSDTVQKQRQSIQEEIKKSLEDARERRKASLDRLAGRDRRAPEDS